MRMASSFGAQKLGEKVMEPQTEVDMQVEDEEQVLFSPGNIGSGTDERAGDVTVEDITSGLDQINRIDKSFRQYALLMTLGDESALGLEQKSERVLMAAAEGLLPDEFSSESTVQSSAITAAGLMDDWNFEM